MIITTLTKLPSQLECELLSLSLATEDAIVVTAESISLAFQPCKFQAQAWVRQADLEMCGGHSHADWQVMSDEKWCEMILSADKSVSW